MHKPHTIGEVIREVIDLSRPHDANDIRLGRMHDGMIINLATRMMDSVRHEDITDQVVLHIRSIVGRYQSLDITSALEFLDNVRTAPEQPGIIGTIGGMMVRRMRSVLSMLKTTSTIARGVSHAPEGAPQPTQGDAAGETA